MQVTRLSRTNSAIKYTGDNDSEIVRFFREHGREPYVITEPGTWLVHEDGEIKAFSNEYFWLVFKPIC